MLSLTTQPFPVTLFTLTCNQANIIGNKAFFAAERFLLTGRVKTTNKDYNKLTCPNNSTNQPASNF